MRALAIASLLVIVAVSAEAQQPTARPTGHSTTGLPALNYDADEGFGYGNFRALFESIEHEQGAGRTETPAG